MPRVFLSHSSKDKAFARKLASKLQENEIEVWIDEAELRVGDSLTQKIGTGISETDFMAVILSHNSVNSEWVKRELAVAMNRELAEKEVRVLPILKEPCDIPPFLQDKVYADFTDPESFEAPFSRLLHALGVERPTTAVTEEPVYRTEGEQLVEISGLEGFENISITGVDRDRTYKPDPSKLLYNVYFELSDYPPQEWVEIFDAERQFPRHTMWRRAWIEGRYIVVYCVPEEVGKYHLRDIKQDVETCNERYREYLQREAIHQARQAQREAEEERALEEALDNLDFS